MTFRGLERWDTRVKFFRRISLITFVLFDLKRPNSAGWNIMTCGVRVQVYFLGDTVYRKGAWPMRSPILGVPFIYVYTIWHGSTKFDVVTHERLLGGNSHTIESHRLSAIWLSFLFGNGQMWRCSQTRCRSYFVLADDRNFVLEL